MLIDDLVKEAFENAKENGYDLSVLNTKYIAADMISYDASIENYVWHNNDISTKCVAELHRAIEDYLGRGPYVRVV